MSTTNSYMLTTGSVNYAGEVRSTIQCLVSPGAKLPERQHHWDAGADLFACLEDSKTIYLEPGQQQLVDTGVAVKVPYGYVGLVYNRSSQGKKGITIPHSVGVIDAEYRGTIKVLLKNTSNETYQINQWDRIAQLVIQKVEIVQFQDIWNDTQRGTGGFGSTGT
jgi:dUTP pyrophosphatase